MLSNKIIEFLKERHLISVSGLEQTLQLPESTIRQAMTGSREIPFKYLHKVIVHLIDYGFKLNDYIMKHDTEDGTIVFEKIGEQVKVIDKGDHFEYHCIVYRDILHDDLAVSHFNYKQMI